MLPTLSADDLGRPIEPGVYDWEGAVVTVDRQHIQHWSENPQAVFRTIICTKANDKGLRLTLGAVAS